MRILKNSNEVRHGITDLMKPSGNRRVAIVAFVGLDADAYIPKPAGVEIICWPRAGGTNPTAIRRLLRNGADVRFADNLHMKVYWAKGRGAIISSANLSTNALGAGGLKEIGVRLPSSAINIDKLMESVKPYKWTKRKIDELEIEHRKLNAGRQRKNERGERVEYQEWYSDQARAPWKFGWWDEWGAFGAEAKNIARSYYNKKSPHDFVSASRHGDYRKNDWILTFRLKRPGPPNVKWLFVEEVIPTSRRDVKAFDPDYPFQAIQMNPAKCCPAPPFILTRDFKMSLRKACASFGIEKLMKLPSVIPPTELLKLIRDELP